MTGKNKCKILKEIRRQIAENNDIELIIDECTYKGECRGTCPRCEAELRYLEAELLKRKNAGKSVAVAGLAAVMLAASGCTNEPAKSNAGHESIASSSFEKTQSSVSSSDTVESYEDMGETPVYSEGYNSGYELEGDVAYPSESPEIDGSIPAYPSSSRESSSRLTIQGGYPPSSQDQILFDVNYLLDMSEKEKEEFLNKYDLYSLRSYFSKYDNVSYELEADYIEYYISQNGITHTVRFFYNNEKVTDFTFGKTTD